MFRDAYSPEYTANNTTRPWLTPISRFFTATATNVSSSNPAKHFCAT